MISIRVFTPQYAAGVVSVILPIQQSEFGITITLEDQPDVQNIQGFYQVANGNFWVALAGDEVIGTIGLLDIGDRQGALRKMFVKSEYRGARHGVATALLNELLSWSQRKEYREVFLGTTDKFVAAHRFYEKSGFHEVPRASLPTAFPVMQVDSKFYRIELARNATWNGRTMDAVERWFGEGFKSLHPLLQDLHREGGTLVGTASIEYGAGLAGWLGQRMASRFGIPKGASSVPLRVTIRSDERRLYWGRVFAGASRVDSVFEPVGAWPDGHWLERTGALELALKIDSTGGGWRWLPFKFSVSGIPVPPAFMPKVTAYKAIEDGRYRFCVGVTLPLVGFVFSYSGALSADNSLQRTTTTGNH